MYTRLARGTRQGEGSNKEQTNSKPQRQHLTLQSGDGPQVNVFCAKLFLSVLLAVLASGVHPAFGRHGAHLRDHSDQVLTRKTAVRKCKQWQATATYRTGERAMASNGDVQESATSNGKQGRRRTGHKQEEHATKQGREKPSKTTYKHTVINGKRVPLPTFSHVFLTS
jgi:hypothetical protein